MTADSDHAHDTRPGLHGRALLDALAERRGILPVKSMDDLASDVFDTDADLDEFLASTYTARHADLG
jgi:hypothetical protein